MKLIAAFIQPTRLQAVQEALTKAGVGRMTVCDAQGFGQQHGKTETYRGVEYTTHLLRKIALEITVNDDFVERTVETIVGAARTSTAGNIGDGKIFILPVEQVYRVSDGASGPEAV